MPRKIAAGNWKMNGLRSDLDTLEALTKAHIDTDIDIVICPPAQLLFPACKIVQGTQIQIGAQDCHTNISGAHTGDISGPMVADTGAKYVIIGHSERRETYAESDNDVRHKAQAARDAGLTAILCIGETLETREAGKTLEIIGLQLAGSVPDDISNETLIIAYEPIWAIGTGKVPSLEQIIEVHDFIRADLSKRFGTDIANQISLLYGGSVKASNASEIFTAKNVNGALVGGASLSAKDFSPIIDSLNNS